MKRDEYLSIQSADNNLRNSIDEQGWTNEVLIHEKKNQTEIFLPCYLRTKLKNIVSLDPSTGKGTINLVIILSVYYGSIQNYFKDFVQKIKQSIILRFKIDPAMKLTQGFSQFTDVEGNERSNYVTIKVDEKQQLITYSIRKTLVVPLISHIFWSPFQLIKYVSTILIDSLSFDDKDGRYKVYFNLMDISQQLDRYTVVSFTEEGALGEYDLAKSLIQAEFTNKRFYSGDLQQQLNNSRHKLKSSAKEEIKDVDDQNHSLKMSKIKVQPFQFGHSVYPVFRRPLVPFFNIFFPIMILGFINLAIFFQDNLNSGKKIMNIGALMISYIAFLPTIRAKIPPSKSLVISQILVFSMASLTLFTLFHTIKVRDTHHYEFNWNKQIPFFSALIITLVIIGILCAISLAFIFVFNPKFNKNEQKSQVKFNKKDWLNKGCDSYFNKLRQVGFDIKPILQYSKSRKSNKRNSKKK